MKSFLFILTCLTVMAAGVAALLVAGRGGGQASASRPMDVTATPQGPPAPPAPTEVPEVIAVYHPDAGAGAAGRAAGVVPAAYRLAAPKAAAKGAAVTVIDIPGNTLLDPGVAHVVKTDAEWRKILSPEAYYITREKGTERAFTGAYDHNKAAGWYVCVACGNPLFGSDAKFDSGTGWPSFWKPLAPTSIRTESDRSLFMVRNEVLCARCDSHLGHVFDDGPAPTHLRYCMNSAALRFIPKK